MKNVYKSFVTDYPIVSIEDPFDQDDWDHYAKLTSEIGEQVQIVGDDLLVTNPKVKDFMMGLKYRGWLCGVFKWFMFYACFSVWRKQLRRRPAMLFY